MSGAPTVETVPDDRSALRSESEDRHARCARRVRAPSRWLRARPQATRTPRPSHRARRCPVAAASAAQPRAAHAPATTRARSRACSATANTALSVNNCRTIRPRLAPTAARIASSRCRVTPRDSSRLATFAHAISNTSATATAMIDSAGRAAAVMSSTSGRAWTTTGPPLPKKNSVSRCLGAARDRRAFGLDLRQRDARLQSSERREGTRRRSAPSAISGSRRAPRSAHAGPEIRTFAARRRQSCAPCRR